MITDTSLLAYMNEQESLTGRRQRVFSTLANNPEGLTDLEIMFKLGYAIPNMVRPRRNELYKQGLVKCNGTRRCTISNRKAKTWVKK